MRKRTWRPPSLRTTKADIDQYVAAVQAIQEAAPGAGDVAVAVGQLLADSEIVVAITPQVAAAEVAERASSVAAQTNQRRIGVIENMSWLGDGSGCNIHPWVDVWPIRRSRLCLWRLTPQ